MTRLQNAQNMLAESLAALESAIAVHQQRSPEDTEGRSTIRIGVASNSGVDIAILARDIAAIEADLDDAMRLISNLSVMRSTGDAQ
jgi:hypothetical protein